MHHATRYQPLKNLKVRAALKTEIVKNISVAVLFMSKRGDFKSEMKPSCPRKCIFPKKTVVIMFLFSNHALSKEEYYEKSSFEDGTDGWDLKNWKRMKLDEVKKLHPSFPQPDDLNDKVSSIFLAIFRKNSLYTSFLQ